MTRKLISTGSPFEKTAGYSRAVVQGDWCFVAGTTGYDYATMSMPDAVEEQARNALDTIRKALTDAGFDMADAEASLPSFMWESAESVAKVGVDALAAGHPVAIPGMANRIGANVANLVPKRLLVPLLARRHPGLKRP